MRGHCLVHACMFLKFARKLAYKHYARLSGNNALNAQGSDCGPKIGKNAINSSTKSLVSVKIAILTPTIIPPPLASVWLIFDL